MRRTLGSGFVVGAAGLACGGLMVDVDGLQRVEEVLRVASPEVSIPLFFAGSAQAALVNPRCAPILEGAAGADPSMRGIMLAAGLSDTMRLCPAACADLDGVARMEEEERIRTVVSRCAGEGDDPFGGPLSPLRDRANALEYLWVRMLVERAVASSPSFAELEPTLAIGLALGGTPELHPTPQVFLTSSRPMPSEPFTAAADALRACDPPDLAHRMIVDPNGAVVGVEGASCTGDVLRGLSFAAGGDWTVIDVTWAVPATDG